MSDLSVILDVLRAAPGVVLVEPGPHLVMQDEVHAEAKDELARRGLPASHPYLGWHTQAAGFDSAGALVRPHRVCFGGDRAAVARAMAGLERHGFAVLGGRGDDEVFVVRPDAAPPRVGPELAGQWRTRLAVLGDDLLAPMRDGEAAQVHELVAHPGMRDLLAPAVRALRLRGELSTADLDVALTPDGLTALGKEAPAAVVHALEAGHPMAEGAAASLAAQGGADGELLYAWNDPGALRAARESALSGRNVNVYLDLAEHAGADPVRAAVTLATEIRDGGGADAGTLVTAVAVALVARFGGGRRGHALAALRDQRVPPWLRVVIADRWTRTFGTAEAAGDPEEVAAWPAVVDEVRAATGLPPSPGFDPGDRLGQDAAVEHREAVVARHLDGLRAALARPDLEEPAVAVLLELLHGAGALRAQDLAHLSEHWRTRLFVPPGRYTCAAPAVVTYAAALVAVGDPAGWTVAETVARDTRSWSLPARLLLRGALARGRDSDLAAEADLVPLAHGGGEGAAHAAHALSLVRARSRRLAPVAAACRGILEAPEFPLYVRNGFAYAAVTLAEGGTGLWSHYFRDRSVRALEAALRVAGDERLPPPARRVVLAVADRTKVLDHPEHARPVPVRPADVDRLRALRRQVGARLGV